MKYAISYFYQIRNFKKNMIPFSTAVWDPKWYHNNLDNRTIYVDKNGVINGCRCEELKPGITCNNLCKGVKECNIKDPNICKFLSNYRKQLNKIDFNSFLNYLNIHLYQIQKIFRVEDPMIVFIVYETPTNQCSEREVIKQWFKDNGIELEELKYPIEENY